MTDSVGPMKTYKGSSKEVLWAHQASLLEEL